MRTAASNNKLVQSKIFFGSFFLLFLSADASVTPVTLEAIVNQNTFHVHHHHVRMAVHVDNRIHFHMNANVHPVSTKPNSIYFPIKIKLVHIT